MPLSSPMRMSLSKRCRTAALHPEMWRDCLSVTAIARAIIRNTPILIDWLNPAHAASEKVILGAQLTV